MKTLGIVILLWCLSLACFMAGCPRAALAFGVPAFFFSLPAALVVVLRWVGRQLRYTPKTR